MFFDQIFFFGPIVVKNYSNLNKTAQKKAIDFYLKAFSNTAFFRQAQKLD